MQILIWIAAFLSLHADYVSGNAATDIVKDFYSQLEIISAAPDGDEAFYAKNRCKELCGASTAFINYPNEFKEFMITNKHVSESVEIGAYLKMFTEVSLDKYSFTAIYIRDAKTYAKPEFVKGELPDDFASVIVVKEYRKKGNAMRLVDTVVVNMSEKHILGISNKMGGYRSPQKEDVRKNVVELMEKAQRQYALKRFKLAYETFREIIRIDNENAKAYYYLALMSFHKMITKCYT